VSTQTYFEHSVYSLLPTHVEGFDSLVELALDMRWSWNHATDGVWCQSSEFFYAPLVSVGRRVRSPGAVCGSETPTAGAGAGIVVGRVRRGASFAISRHRFSIP
jgi:hypothetical protein